MIGSKQTPKTPSPTALTVHNQSRVLEIVFDDGAELPDVGRNMLTDRIELGGFRRVHPAADPYAFG